MHDTLRYRALKPRTKRGVREIADAHISRIKKTIINAAKTARNSVTAEELQRAFENAQSAEQVVNTTGAVFKAILSSQLTPVIMQTMAAGGTISATRARKRGSFRHAGGAGSGNFGHGGRPGEVGGSGDSTADQAKATKALSALPQHGMAAIVQSYDARKNPLNQGQSMGDDSPWTEEKTYITEAMDKEENFSYLVLNGKEKEVAIGDLTSYQTWVGPERVEAHISKLGKGTRSPLAVVYRFEGKNWIVDGNHRIAAAKLAGHKTVRVILAGKEAKQLRAAAEGIVWTPSVLPELMFVNPDDPRRIADYAERNALFAVDARSAEVRAAKKGPLGNLRFDMTNPRAVAWARNHSSTLISGIDSQTRDAIRAIIARAFTDGIPIPQASRMIRPLIGLTDQQSQAVLNLRQRIEENPGGKVWAGNRAIRVPEDFDEEWLQGKLTGYADSLLIDRANMIGRTESIAAANYGQQELWLQAVEEGLLRGTEQRTWIITPDERLCEMCDALDGTLADLDGMFETEDGDQIPGPPAHPNCRCSQGLSASPSSQDESSLEDASRHAGGAGSGNFGHGGRPGEVGGSTSDSVAGPISKRERISYNKSAQKKWENSLTGPQKETIGRYTSDSFVDIRDYQEGGKDSSVSVVYSTKDLKEQIAAGGKLEIKGEEVSKISGKSYGVKAVLTDQDGNEINLKSEGPVWIGKERISSLNDKWESALDSAPDVSGTIYRGSDPVSTKQVGKLFKEGSTVKLGADSSYTASYGVATKFASDKAEFGDDKPVIFRVEATHGKLIAELSRNTNGGSFRKQREVILRRGARLKVSQVSVHKKYIIVDLKQKS